MGAIHKRYETGRAPCYCKKLFQVKMKAFKVFVLLLIGMMMSMVDGQCPVGWTFYFTGGMCYKFFQGERTYDEAYYLCKEQGGEQADIAVASDEGRNNFIAFTFTDQDVWLGVRKITNRGKFWRWDDGTSWDYENWRTGRDSNRGYTNNVRRPESCMILRNDIRSQSWFEQYFCGNTAQTICQVPSYY